MYRSLLQGYTLCYRQMVAQLFPLCLSIPVHYAKLYSLEGLDKLCRTVSLSVGVLFNSLPCLSVFSNAVEWCCFVNLFSS